MMVNGTVSFGCNEGFSLSEDSIILYCNEEGSWVGGQPPACIENFNINWKAIGISIGLFVLIAFVSFLLYKKFGNKKKEESNQPEISLESVGFIKKQKECPIV